MRNVVILGCIILTMLSVSVFAESESSIDPKKWEPHGFISSTFQEKYVGLRVSRNFYDDPMHWTEAYLDLPNNFFLDVWWSIDLQDDEISSTWGDEVDFTLGWQSKLWDMDAVFSVSQYICAPFGELWGKSNAWSQDFILSKKISLNEDHSITPSFWVGYISINDNFEEGAMFTLPNIKHEWKKPFGIENLTFSQTAMLAWDDGFCDNSSDGLFLRYTPALNWQISDRLSITAPGAILLNPLTDPHDGRGSETSLSASIAYKF